jgi:hypothetical protein
MEGHATMVSFLKFLDAAAHAMPNIKFSIREHPAMPLGSVIKKSGISMYPDGPLIENNETELIDAMEAADIVIYQATTASMTAAYLGIPIIKFQSDEPLEDDPLFQSPHLKRRVRTLAELQNAIIDFSNLDIDTYLQEVVLAKSYVEHYLASPTLDNMKVFLK